MLGILKCIVIASDHLPVVTSTTQKRKIIKTVSSTNINQRKDKEKCDLVKEKIN